MTARNQSNRAGDAVAGDAGDWVAIGEVVGVFGVHGELKVQPLTDFPERFSRTETVYVGERRVPRRVRGAHPHKRLMLVSLEGIDDPETGAKLRGARLYIPETQITPLPEDQFYLHDVIGLRVRHVGGRLLGVVSDVVTAAGNDLFVVRTSESGREVLLPAVKAFVKRIDLAGGEIVVDPIPGLFDDEAIVAGDDRHEVDDNDDSDDSDDNDAGMGERGPGDDGGDESAAKGDVFRA